MLISTEVVSDILAHAREEAPRECCGLLLGSVTKVERSVRTRNRASDPVRRFLVDPTDHFAAIRFARSARLEIVGAYHSHPSGPPVPSATDLSEAHSGREFLHVILALLTGELRAYTIANGVFEQQSVTVSS